MAKLKLKTLATNPPTESGALDRATEAGVIALFDGLAKTPG